MTEAAPMIYKLISSVMEEIGFVAKTRRNEQQGYSFRGIEDMYQAAHPALVKHGVFCCPQVLEYVTESKTTKSGSPAIHAILKISHKFYAPDGSFVEVITCGEGVDSSDKAINKCMSAAMKYAFIELFSIPTKDIEDSDRTSPESGVTQEPVTLTRPLPVNPPDDSGFIAPEKRSYLARRFRESLKKEFQFRDNELRHAALVAMQQSKLFKSQFIDKDGNPTSDMILDNEFDAIGKALVKAAKSIS